MDTVMENARQALALHRAGRHAEAAGLQAGIDRRDGAGGEARAHAVGARRQDDRDARAKDDAGGVGLADVLRPRHPARGADAQAVRADDEADAAPAHALQRIGHHGIAQQDLAVGFGVTELGGGQQ